MGVLVNGTMGPLEKGTISVMPINYKLRSGKTQITQDFGPSVFSTTIPITITPATSYEHTTIEVLVSFANAPANAVLTAKVWIG